MPNHHFQIGRTEYDGRELLLVPCAGCSLRLVIRDATEAQLGWCVGGF